MTKPKVKTPNAIDTHVGRGNRTATERFDSRPAPPIFPAMSSLSSRTRSGLTVNHLAKSSRNGAGSTKTPPRAFRG
jgi:hypothetical protein